MGAGIFIAGAFSIILGLVAGQWWFGQRQWVARWRGHQISIRYEKGKVLLDVDDERVLEDGLWPIFGGKHKGIWTHPALGETEVVIAKNVVGANGEYTRTLQIGDEVIPLAEVPMRWRGARAMLLLRSIDEDERAAFISSLGPADVEALGDPRWIAACRILQMVRDSSAVNEDARQVSNVLQRELRECFASRLRLADPSVAALGGEGPALETVRARLEEMIQSALEAVKSLHMAVVSMEAHADESREMDRVREIIEGLQAEEEVARFVARLPKEEDLEAPAWDEAVVHEER